MQKKRWSDLSMLQKVGIVIAGTVQIGLLAAGLWDVAHRTAEEVRGDRHFWMGFMFVNWIGPIAYFVYGRKDSPLRLWGCKRGEEAAEPAVTEEAAELAEPSTV